MVSGEGLRGYVSVRRGAAIDRAEWTRRTVGEVTAPCAPDATVSPDDDALKALSVMSRTGNSRLMVVEEGRLAGIIALKDLLQFLSLKLELHDM